MKHIARKFPEENLLYVADTANVPYGNKKPSTINRLSLRILAHLLEKKCKIIVVACSTVSAVALESLQKISPVPVIGVITPGVELAIKATRSKKIGVIATKATIQSAIYQREILAKLEGAHVFSEACPHLVLLIEQGKASSKEAKELLRTYLAPLKEAGIDTLLLGCTHFPLLKNLIAKEMGKDVALIEPGAACLVELQTELQKNDLKTPPNNQGQREFIVTGAKKRLEMMGAKILNHRFESIRVALSKQ